MFGSIANRFGGPKYDGKHLHSIINEKLGEPQLRSTLTNVVIPTFDIKNLQLTDKSLFKTLKEKEDGYVTFGDGSHSQVLGKGTVDIPELPLLTDVLYIKGLKVNLGPSSINTVFE